MCGRFALYDDIQTIKEQFQVEDVPSFDGRYNIPPSSKILCILEEDGQRVAQLMHWGLIPFWAKDKKISSKLINARAETIHEKPAFRNAFKNNHCIVVMSGFFEWKNEGSYKQPYYFENPNHALLAVASIWEEWEDKENKSLVRSCCLITTNANQVMNPIHHRMPLILDNKAQNGWLNNNTNDINHLLKEESNVSLHKLAVSSKMNSPAFQGEEAVKSIESSCMSHINKS